MSSMHCGRSTHRRQSFLGRALAAMSPRASRSKIERDTPSHSKPPLRRAEHFSIRRVKANGPILRNEGVTYEPCRYHPGRTRSGIAHHQTSSRSRSRKTNAPGGLIRNRFPWANWRCTSPPPKATSPPWPPWTPSKIRFSLSRSPELATKFSRLFPRVIENAKETLGKMDDARLKSTWTLTKNGKTIMAIPRIDFSAPSLLNHVYHHRGQLSVYLRMLDVPVPSIYGPSADENPFN